MSVVAPAAPAPLAREEAAARFVEDLVAELEPLQRACNEALWEASVTGLEVKVVERARLDAEVRAIFSRPAPLAFLRETAAAGAVSDPLVQRQLEILLGLFRSHQVARPLLERMVQLEAGIELRFNEFWAGAGGTRGPAGGLAPVPGEPDDRAPQVPAWSCPGQIGEGMVDELLELVRLRNLAARAGGFADYYAMRLELDELDGGELLDLFDELERGTRRLSAARSPDAVGSVTRLRRVAPREPGAWPSGGPWFSDAPAAGADRDRCFRGRDLVRTAERFFAAIGLGVHDVLVRSDLEDRAGKSRQAFCLSLDRGADVRVLCHVRPTEAGMSDLLHELGHAVYERGIERSLPYLLRAPAHTLTTEASAMLFARMSRNPAWLAHHAGMDRAASTRTGAAAGGALRSQLLPQLRWWLVLCRMERELYRDPSRDLDTLWWDLVAEHQRVRRPDRGRSGHWASQIHFVTAPVYCHNYLLGEIAAAQLQRALLDRLTGDAEDGWDHLVASPDLGHYLGEHLFRPGKTFNWRQAIRHSTGASLSPDALLADLGTPD